MWWKAGQCWETLRTLTVSGSISNRVMSLSSLQHCKKLRRAYGSISLLPIQTPPNASIPIRNPPMPAKRSTNVKLLFLGWSLYSWRGRERINFFEKRNVWFPSQLWTVVISFFEENHFWNVDYFLILFCIWCKDAVGERSLCTIPDVQPSGAHTGTSNKTRNMNAVASSVNGIIRLLDSIWFCTNSFCSVDFVESANFLCKNSSSSLAGRHW